jgi:hypothetical protein
VSDGDCDCPESHTPFCVLASCNRKRHGWRVLGATLTEPAIVYPLADLRDHDLGDERCWCHPTYDEGVLVHHSMDRREELEAGRLAS